MTPHEILGVAPDADAATIKSAYRKLAMKYHPDRNGDSPESLEKFREVQEAYDKLTKPQAQHRQGSYGGHSSNPFDGHPFGPGFTWNFWEQHPRTNMDFQARARITLEQAFHGAQLSVSINGEVITIAVPPGVQHGQILTVEGKGSREIADLPPGNLQVIILIAQHAKFQFSGSDLLYVHNIDVLDMMTGCQVDVETISGETLSVTVPAGSTPQTRLRVPGKGMPVQGGTARGALFVQLNPLFPNLTPEQIEKLREIRKA